MLLCWISIFTIICIKEKTCKWNHFGWSGLYALLSGFCSSFEGFRDEDGKDRKLKQDFKLRPISKIVATFNSIGYSVLTATVLLEDNSTKTNSRYTPQNCTDWCLLFDLYKANQTQLLSYCTGPS